MSRLASDETSKSIKFRRSQDIEKDIQVAKENNDKASEVFLKRELKKSLIREHTETSSPMPSKDVLDPLEYAKCTVGDTVIYVGSARPALFSAHMLVSKLGVRGILNVTKEDFSSSTLDLCRLGQLKLLQIPIADRPTENIEMHFEKACNFIESFSASSSVNKNGNCSVYVHCQRGISRSPAIVMAYAVSKGIPIGTFVPEILSKRPQVRPNNGFWEMLRTYEIKIRGKSSVTLDYFSNSHSHHSSLTMEERLIQIGKAKENMNYKPSFIAATKKYYQNCVSDGLLRSNNRKIVHFVRHGEGFHNLLARLIGKKAYM